MKKRQMIAIVAELTLVMPLVAAIPSFPMCSQSGSIGNATCGMC